MNAPNHAVPFLEELKQNAYRLKAETFALYLAARHHDTPWHAKLMVAAITAYAFKWIRILYRCWQTKTPYNESVYLKALKRRGPPLLNPSTTVKMT